MLTVAQSLRHYDPTPGVNRKTATFEDILITNVLNLNDTAPAANGPMISFGNLNAGNFVVGDNP